MTPEQRKSFIDALDDLLHRYTREHDFHLDYEPQKTHAVVGRCFALLWALKAEDDDTPTQRKK